MPGPFRYFDASALVKRYVHEVESPAVNRWLGESSSATCRLSEAEIAATLARKLRDHELSSATHKQKIALLNADLVSMRVIEMSPAIFVGVNAVVERYPLRAGDALHLAAALILRDVLGEELEFVCYDTRLRRAAQAEGLRVLP